MRIAVPLESDLGKESRVSAHFGSAPCFAVVDSETGAFEIVSNGDAEHVHGACHPARTMLQLEVDAVLVGGIGRNALIGLQTAGIRAFQAPGGTLDEAIAAVQSGRLAEFDAGSVCGGHGHGHGCGCHHHA